MAAANASSETAPAPGLYVSKIASSNPPQTSEVVCAACECCGLTEECTPAYIARVRERFCGRWICGLCGEAVKDELCRSDRLIGMDEALEAHMTFCMQFRANPAARLVGALRQLLRKNLGSSSLPRGGLRSNPTSPCVLKRDIGRPGLARATSSFSTLTPPQAEKTQLIMFLYIWRWRKGNEERDDVRPNLISIRNAHYYGLSFDPVVNGILVIPG